MHETFNQIIQLRQLAPLEAYATSILLIKESQKIAMMAKFGGTSGMRSRVYCPFRAVFCG